MICDARRDDQILDASGDDPTLASGGRMTMKRPRFRNRADEEVLRRSDEIVIRRGILGWG